MMATPEAKAPKAPTRNVHLDKARSCARRSDAALRDCAIHIRAAMASDPGLTQKDVGAYVGKSGRWVSVLLRWYDSGAVGPMYAFDSDARLARAMAQGIESGLDWTPEGVDWHEFDYGGWAKGQVRWALLYARRGREAGTAKDEDVQQMAEALREGARRLDLLLDTEINNREAV